MSVVYFIQVQPAGPIKIGITSGPVEGRLSDLRSACPYPVRLLGTVPGTIHHEQWLHRKFVATCTSGEWFEPNAGLLSTIAEVLAPGWRWPDTLSVSPAFNRPHQALIDQIDAFLIRSGMTASEFGQSALNDRNFVGDLRKGRMPRIDLVDRVHGFIRSREGAAA